MARESGWWDCRHSMFGWRGVNRCGRRAIRGGATLAEIGPCCCLRKFLELYEALRTEKDFKTNRVAALARLTGWAAPHQSLANREPALTILANARRAAAGELKPPSK